MTEKRKLFVVFVSIHQNTSATIPDAPATRTNPTKKKNCPDNPQAQTVLRLAIEQVHFQFHTTEHPELQNPFGTTIAAIQREQISDLKHRSKAILPRFANINAFFIAHANGLLKYRQQTSSPSMKTTRISQQEGNTETGHILGGKPIAALFFRIRFTLLLVFRRDFSGNKRGKLLFFERLFFEKRLGNAIQRRAFQ